MKTFLYSFALLVALAPVAVHAQKRPDAARKKSNFHVWNEAFQTHNLAVLGVLCTNENVVFKPKEQKKVQEAVRYANQEVSYVVDSKLSNDLKKAKIMSLQQSVVKLLQKTLPSPAFKSLIQEGDRMDRAALMARFKVLSINDFDSTFMDAMKTNLDKTDALGGTAKLVELAR